MNKIGIAVWGIGNHALKKIIPAIQKSSQLKLVGIFSRDFDNVKKLSKEFNCIGWNSKDEMVKNSDVKVVYISTPTGIHYDCVQYSLKYNKNVWCEKPLTNSVRDTKKLISLAENKNLSISEGFMYLYHPQYMEIKRFINNYKENRLSIACRFGIPYLSNPGYRYSKNLSGGAFYDVGCYPISIISEIFKDHKIFINYSEINHNKKFEVDINGKALLKIDLNKSVYLEWAYGKSYRNDIDIWGETNSLYSDKIFSKPDTYYPSLVYFDKSGEKKISKIKKNNHFLLMFQNFVKNLDYIKFREEQHNCILNRAKLTEKIKNKAFKLRI